MASRNDGLLDMFTLGDPLKQKAFRADCSKHDYEYLRSARRGEQQENLRPQIRHDGGNTLMDFIWVSLVPIISIRVADALDASGCSGWGTYPVEVFDGDGKAVAGYVGLSIMGRCKTMLIDREHSETVFVEYPKAIAPKYKGLYIPREGYDGMDLFVAADYQTNYICVTERVRSVFERAKISNVVLTPISEVSLLARDQPDIRRNQNEFIN